MSTVCKIDRGVRLARFRRREAIAALTAMRSRPGDIGIVSGILAQRLDGIRRDSTVPGWLKYERFKRILGAPTLAETRPIV